MTSLDVKLARLLNETRNQIDVLYRTDIDNASVNGRVTVVYLNLLENEKQLEKALKSLVKTTTEA